MELQKNLHISTYKIDRGRLENAWRTIGAPDFAWKDREFLVDFAQGFPVFYGVLVQPPKEPEAIASLTLRPAEKQKKAWNLCWLRKYIDLKISEFGSQLQVSEGQIAFALFKSIRGDSISNLQLYPAKATESVGRAKNFKVFSFPQSSELYLAIQDPLTLLNSLSPSEILKRIRQEIDVLTTENPRSYIVLESAIIDALREKSRSLSIIGLDSPLNILVAIPESDQPALSSDHDTSLIEPVSTSSSLAVARKEMVYDDSITRNMGPLHFDGDVIIKGSIETEAQISSSGNMLVMGQVKGAQVRCYGNLQIEGGISMGDTGRIFVAGNLKVAFIESANVVCQGYMEVSKSILNSEVYVGQNLMLTGQESLIAGGTISCRGVVKVAHLGLRLGNKTILRLGVDWRSDSRIISLQRRTSWVESYMVAVRTELRDLVANQKNSRDLDIEARKVKLQAHLQRCRTLLDKLALKKNTGRSNYTYHYQSQAIILGRIDPNCEISICDKPVRIDKGDSGVVIRVTERGQPLVSAA